MPRASKLFFPLVSCAILFSAVQACDLRSITVGGSCFSTEWSGLSQRISTNLVERSFFSQTRHIRPTFLTSATSRSLLLGDQLRGGSDTVKNEEEDENSDTESEAEEEDHDAEDLDVELENHNDGESETEEENDEAINDTTEVTSEYDEPLVASPMTQLYATFGVMMLSKKFDLYNPILVRLARFAFIGYLVALQLFVLWVRIQAKTRNDRTSIQMTNPISNLLQTQLQGADNNNAMMKNLASSFLSSESTVMEYDLKQARSMQGGILFNMCFMWFLHFKMNQMQPLLINTVTGIMNLYYSPLFQVYVLQRNLERPFKSTAQKQYEAPSVDADSESAATATATEKNATKSDAEMEEDEETAAEDGDDSDSEDDNAEEEEDSDEGSEDSDDE